LLDAQDRAFRTHFSCGSKFEPPLGVPTKEYLAPLVVGDRERWKKFKTLTIALILLQLQQQLQPFYSELHGNHKKF
jgi:hypothetical protein